MADHGIASHLTPPDPALFFSKNDPGDPRMGDLVTRDATSIPPAARVAIIGVPQDIGVERNGGRVGAAGAPEQIRRWLYRLTPFDIETSRMIPDGLVVDFGNIDCDGELEQIHERLSAVVADVCASGLVPIVLGGGHDITYATITGAARAHGPLGAINLDAHLDVRPPAPARNSGTPFRMLIDEGSLVAGAFIEYGIQSFANAASHAGWLVEKGGRIITLEEIRARGFAKMLATAWQIATSNAERIYGSLDIDGVRAADAPGASAAMPDGFSAEELFAAARQLGRRTATVGLDVVEVNPLYDRDGITAKLAAHAVLRFIAGVAER
jgi:formimidoylglutamase